jgi:hypothetical protein
MNKNQKVFVISALVAIAAVLAFVFLDWSDGYGISRTKIVTFYSTPDPRYPNLTDNWGLYTPYGIFGVLFGLIAPLCLIATAAYMALGIQPTNSN